MKQGSTGGVLRILLALVFSVDICRGKITSFSVSSERREDCILLDTDVILACDVDDDSSTIAIKRLKDGALVNRSRVGEKSLNYVIYNVSCFHMGTYVCILDNTERLTADLVIAECTLQPCDGADVNRTVFVNVGDPVHFSVCVLVCKSIAPNAKFNDTVVRKNNLSDWTWNYEPIASTGLPITRFNVNVTHKRMDTKAYGLVRVRLFSSYDKRHYLDFHILLQPPGPPHCPTDIDGTHFGHDYVILSWKPGFDGGSKQHFYVYYSKDKVTWYTQGKKTENTTEHVSGLSSHTRYYFRVASWNQYRTSVDSSTCTRTVFVLTNLIKPIGLFEDLKGSDIVVLILGVCSLLVVILFLSVFFCWRRKVNREHARHAVQVNAEEVATQDRSISGPRDYVSDDGLKYITVYPVHDKRRKTKKKRMKHQKVEYSTVDFIKTAKLGRNPAPK